MCVCVCVCVCVYVKLFLLNFISFPCTYISSLLHAKKRAFKFHKEAKQIKKRHILLNLKGVGCSIMIGHGSYIKDH